MRKYSRQREAILQALKSTKTHPTASRIYDMVRENIPNISLGTVYRNLAQLDKEGNILTLTVKEGSDHFDGNPEPHYHFYCEQCDSFEDLDIPVIEDLDHHPGLDSYEVYRHELMFYGLCAKCKARAQSGTGEAARLQPKEELSI